MFYKWMSIAILGTVSLTFPLSTNAEMPSCYKQIERNFFNPIIVSQALSLHLRIYQSSISVPA